MPSREQLATSRTPSSPSWSARACKNRTKRQPTSSQASQRHAEPPEVVDGHTDYIKWGEFVNSTYLPFYRRKWKLSTRTTNEDRLRAHLTPLFRRPITGESNPKRAAGPARRKSSVRAFSQRRSSSAMGFASDTKDGRQRGTPVTQSRRVAVVPREARHPEYTVMTCSDVRTCLSILAKREQIIFRFAVFGRLRPGEIFGLKWMHIGDAHALISQRVYRGHVDTPKTIRSIRKAAIPAGLLADLRQWKAVSRNSGDDDWVFPSRNKGKPLSRDNVFRRHIAPMLKSAGLGWVNFHVMRRTHATLMNEIVDDPKLVADQLGHTLDVNLNIYTRASLARLKNAVNALEGALCSAKPIEAE